MLLAGMSNTDFAERSELPAFLDKDGNPLFAQIPLHILTCPYLSGRARILYGICVFRGNCKKYHWHSIKSMADESRLSTSTVKRAMRELKMLTLIARTPSASSTTVTHILPLDVAMLEIIEHLVDAPYKQIADTIESDETDLDIVLKCLTPHGQDLFRIRHRKWLADALDSSDRHGADLTPPGVKVDPTPGSRLTPPGIKSDPYQGSRLAPVKGKGKHPTKRPTENNKPNTKRPARSARPADVEQIDLGLADAKERSRKARARIVKKRLTKGSVSPLKKSQARKQARAQRRKSLSTTPFEALTDNEVLTLLDNICSAKIQAWVPIRNQSLKAQGQWKTLVGRWFDLIEKRDELTTSDARHRGWAYLMFAAAHWKQFRDGDLYGKKLPDQFNLPWITSTATRFFGYAEKAAERAYNGKSLSWWLERCESSLSDPNSQYRNPYPTKAGA